MADLEPGRNPSRPPATSAANDIGMLLSALTSRALEMRDLDISGTSSVSRDDPHRDALLTLLQELVVSGMHREAGEFLLGLHSQKPSSGAALGLLLVDSILDQRGLKEVNSILDVVAERPSLHLDMLVGTSRCLCQSGEVEAAIGVFARIGEVLPKVTNFTDRYILVCSLAEHPLMSRRENDVVRLVRRSVISDLLSLNEFRAQEAPLEPGQPQTTIASDVMLLGACLAYEGADILARGESLQEYFAPQQAKLLECVEKCQHGGAAMRTSILASYAYHLFAGGLDEAGAHYASKALEDAVKFVSEPELPDILIENAGTLILGPCVGSGALPVSRSAVVAQTIRLVLEKLKNLSPDREYGAPSLVSDAPTRLSAIGLRLAQLAIIGKESDLARETLEVVRGWREPGFEAQIVAHEAVLAGAEPEAREAFYYPALRSPDIVVDGGWDGYRAIAVLVREGRLREASRLIPNFMVGTQGAKRLEAAGDREAYAFLGGIAMALGTRLRLERQSSPRGA